MFKPTGAKTPLEYISLIDEPRQSEIRTLHDLIVKTVPNLKPRIMAGMISYGTYHYKYASGREGEWSLVALASLKNYISVYVSCMDDGTYLAERYKAQLPKASIGKSCIRFKHLEDIDIDTLVEIIQKAEKLGGVGA